MTPEMNLTLFLDDLLKYSTDQIENLKNLINKPRKHRK